MYGVIFLDLEGEIMYYKPLPFIELEDRSMVVGQDLFCGKTGFLTDDITHWMPADDTFRANEASN